MSENRTDDRVTMKEKIGYGLANIGNIPITALASAFLLIFYTNVVGLSPKSCATLFSPVFKLGIAYITYLLLGVLFPVMDISLNSLLPVMTTDMDGHDGVEHYSANRNQ